MLNLHTSIVEVVAELTFGLTTSRNYWAENVSYKVLQPLLDDNHVNDTPIQVESNYDKPLFPHISCNNRPHGDVFMNYMDQVDDDAMRFFTRGQVERMRGCLAEYRSSFLNP